MTLLLFLAAFRFGRFLARLPVRCAGVLIVALCLQSPLDLPGEPATVLRLPALHSGDVIAFIGGEDIAALRESGHLETILSISFQGVKFRNLGREGDTVFAQPRDVGFPDLAASLKSVGATVLFAQFGRTEALGSGDIKDFSASYGKLLDACAAGAPKVVLVTPPPYESGGGLLPDLSNRNTNLAAYAQAIRELARQRQLPLVDLFAELSDVHPGAKRLTENGLQLTTRGQGLSALAFARQLGLSSIARRAADIGDDGAWKDPQLEHLRQQVMAKDTLWFNYYRPQNWAFLGGDRTSQPSSRDHLNPKIRWFPSEMEKFVPLIQRKEQEIETLAGSLR